MKWGSIKLFGHFWYGGLFYNGKDGEINFLELVNKNRWEVAELSQVVNVLDGSWAIVLSSTDEIFSSVDRVSSRPLFYTKTEERLEVVGSINDFSMEIKKTFVIDKTLKDFYINNKCAPVGRTMYRNVRMIPPGGCLILSDNDINVPVYSGLKARKSSHSSVDVIDARYNLEATLSQMCRTLEVMNPENIFLPLSGGMDSRLLALGLSQSGALKTKTKAFSYGRSIDGKESKISKRVADELGLSWEFIEYTPEHWQELRSNINITFSNFDLASSFPHLQEYISSKIMIERHGVGIFVPGYCLDAPAGKHLYYGNNHQKSFCNSINISGRYRIEDPATNYEYIFLLQRISKNVVPAVRNYEHESCDFIIPFWFNHIYDYWYSRSYVSRKNRNLFSSATEKIYSELCPALNKIGYANQNGNQKKTIVVSLLSYFYGLLHDVYSLPYVKKISRRLFKKKIVNSNKKMDYLGLYNFCKNDTFSTELELEHYHNRVAEISYKFLTKQL